MHPKWDNGARRRTRWSSSSSSSSYSLYLVVTDCHPTLLLLLNCSRVKMHNTIINSGCPLFVFFSPFTLLLGLLAVQPITLGRRQSPLPPPVSSACRASAPSSPPSVQAQTTSPTTIHPNGRRDEEEAEEEALFVSQPNKHDDDEKKAWMGRRSWREA